MATDERQPRCTLRENGLTFTVFDGRRDGRTLYVKKNFKIAAIPIDGMDCINMVIKRQGENDIEMCGPELFGVYVLLDPFSFPRSYPPMGNAVIMSLVGCTKSPCVDDELKGKVFTRLRLVYED